MINVREFLSTVFINVVIKDRTCVLESFSFKGKKLSTTYQRTYNIEEENNKIKNHLESLINSHYFAYVSLFFTSIGQGVLPSKNKADLGKFGIDAGVVSLKSFEDYFLYVANSELNNTLEVLCGLKVDLIYSPFIILHKIIKDRKKDGFSFGDGFVMFVLKYSEFITLMIYKKDELKFASYFELKDNKESDLRSKDIEEEIDVEIEEEFDEVNFEELENIDIDENFNIDETINEEEEVLDKFSLDMMIYNYINNAIKEFYENPIFDSGFISELVFFEHEKTSKAMHVYIENELFIKPVSHKINIFKEMLKLSSSDLGVKIDI